MKNEFGKINPGKLVLPIVISALTLVLSVVLAVVFFVFSLQAQNDSLAGGSGNGVDITAGDVSDDRSNPGKGKVVSEANDEVRAVWIASVANINYPSKPGLTEKQLMAEIDDIIDTCADVGFNTIFFQVRPCGDALYRSEIYPWSEFVSGTQGKAPDGEFDSLEYILKKTKDRGIKVHAWVNPFRVTNGSVNSPKTDVEALSDDNPAKKNPEYTIAYADGKLYYDPGNPEVRELIISGISELCENYPDLAGVHIDDYFYPYPSGNAEFDDGESYEKYGKEKDLADWRRENVNSFVKGAYDAVKKADPKKEFGVSPFGIWANKGSGTYVSGSESSGLEAYHTLYCDALAWVNGGYVDYLVPQVYWSFSTKAAPFDNIARWWNANLDGTGVDLYIGHAAYKAADYGENEIPIQVEFARTLISCKGSAFYGYADVAKNTAGLRDDLREMFSEDIKLGEITASGMAPSVTYPTTGKTNDNATYILGTSDPSTPVTVDGEKVSRTRDGYFSLYTTLSNGKNTFVIKAGKDTVGYTITKGGTSGGGTIKELTTYEITEISPSGETWLSFGDTITVSCSAPSGSYVTAKIGGIEIELKPTLYSATTERNYREVYKGSVQLLADYAPERGEADLGTLTFYAEKNGRKAQKKASLVKQLGAGAPIYAQVINDYSYLKRSPDSSFYGDPTPTSIGMRDYIVGYFNGYYKLRCGYYVSEDDVKIVKNDALYANKLISATVEADIKDTSNNLKNHTDIRFGVLENVPVDIIVGDGSLFVEFFNTDTKFMPKAVVSKNPMVSSVTGSVGETGNIVYEIKLKDAKNYYGFNTVYEDGFIIIRMNNPQSLKKGDKPLYGKTIIVDAGHGGTDMGAPGPAQSKEELHEADLNLYIALELRDKLSELGANVIMVREDDDTVDLYSRIDIMASMIPDLAISVHHNSIANTTNAAKVRGYLGLYSDNAGVLLAESVSDTVCSELSRLQRATAYQALAVARNHRFPTTLCEMSFICNIEEFQWTVTPGNYEKSAQALANGILEYYRRQEGYLKY